MNILILTSCYNPSPEDTKYDNSTTVVRDFAYGFARLGHRVLVVHNYTKTPGMLKFIPKRVIAYANRKFGYNLSTEYVNTAKNTVSIRTESYGVRVARFPLSRTIPKAPFSKSKIDRQYSLIREWLDSEQFVPDEVIGHWEDPQLALLEKMKRDFGVRTTFTSHGCVYLNRPCGKKMLDSLFTVDRVFGRNIKTADYMRQLLGSNANVRICRSGIEDCFFGEKTEIHDKRSFVYVGRLVAYKHLDTVIKALTTHYGKGGFSLTVAGIGSELDYLKTLVKQLNVERDVAFVGQKTREELVELYSLSNLYIMPSKKEMFGLTYLEAMACGCIPVAGNDGGMCGIIQNGSNGYLCIPGDELDLINVLKTVDSMDETALNDIRKKCRETAMAFSIEAQSEKYLKMIINPEYSDSL